MAYLNQKQREAQLLTIVADNQPVSISEIASHMRVAYSTAARFVRQLVLWFFNIINNVVAYSTAARFVRQLAGRKIIQRCEEPRWPTHWETK